MVWHDFGPASISQTETILSFKELFLTASLAHERGIETQSIGVCKGVKMNILITSVFLMVSLVQSASAQSLATCYAYSGKYVGPTQVCVWSDESGLGKYFVRADVLDAKGKIIESFPLTENGHDPSTVPHRVAEYAAYEGQGQYFYVKLDTLVARYTTSLYIRSLRDGSWEFGGRIPPPRPPRGCNGRGRCI